MAGVRDISIEAYNRIKAEGLLSEKRWETYNALFTFGPATAMELRTNMPKSIVDSQIRARLGELREQGIAVEVRERKCSVTGMRAIEWDLNKNIPTKLKKKHKTKCNHCKGSGYELEER